jgi:glycosyltransferase involved in cell wall biosynthesis
MRVLHIIVGLNDGGAEATLYRLILENRDNEHCVISLMDYGKYGKLLAEASCPVYTIGMSRGIPRLINLIKIYRIIKIFEPNVIQSWMYHSDLISTIFGIFMRIPFVWGIHNTVLLDKSSKRRTILISKICAMLSKLSLNKIITCAKAARQAHIDTGYNRHQFIVIPNGYDIDYFKPEEALRSNYRNELRIDEGSFVIGMVARYDPYKDHRNLLDALCLVKAVGMEFSVLLVGTGIDDNNFDLVSDIASRNLSGVIRLLGSRSDINGIMNAIDLHVLSSSAEAFPNVLAESMATCTPCVTTDVGDAADIVGLTGWVVPPRDCNALAFSIIDAINEYNNFPLAWRLRKNQSRKHILDNYTISKISRMYSAVWADAIQ